MCIYICERMCVLIYVHTYVHSNMCHIIDMFVRMYIRSGMISHWKEHSFNLSMHDKLEWIHYFHTCIVCFML